MSTYAISRDLEIPPIAGTCAALQVKCFVKWRKSNCIIKDLIKFIPVLSHHSWTKESNILRKKLLKNHCNDSKSIKEFYWNNILQFQGIKGQNYNNNKPLAGAYSFFSLLRQIEENSLAMGDNFHGNSIPQYGNVK